MLVSFQTHQGAYLYASVAVVVVVVHTVASNRHIGWLVFKCAWRRDDDRIWEKLSNLHHSHQANTERFFFIFLFFIFIFIFRWMNWSTHHITCRHFYSCLWLDKRGREERNRFDQRKTMTTRAEGEEKERRTRFNQWIHQSEVVNQWKLTWHSPLSLSLLLSRSLFSPFLFLSFNEKKANGTDGNLLTTDLCIIHSN